MYLSTKNRTLALTALFAFAAAGLVACGDDDPLPTQTLPQKPQAFPNTAFIAFPVVDATQTDTYKLTVLNGGQEDLVLSDIQLSDDAGGAFSIGSVIPASSTASSLDAVAIEISFTPSARGVYLGTLTVTANAENIQSMVFDIVGPASAIPRPDTPDILAAEDPTPVIESLGLASLRYVNVGKASLLIYGYELTNDSGDAFAIAPGVAQPASRTKPVEENCAQHEQEVMGNCIDPIEVGPGQFVPLGIAYAPAAAGTHTVDVTISSNDPDESALTVQVSGTHP